MYKRQILPSVESTKRGVDELEDVVEVEEQGTELPAPSSTLEIGSVKVTLTLSLQLANSLSITGNRGLLLVI